MVYLPYMICPFVVYIPQKTCEAGEMLRSVESNIIACNRSNSRIWKMAAVWDKIRKEARCSMCLDLYEEPKILPCLHTFCKRCLTFKCPTAISPSGPITQGRKCCLCPEKFALSSVKQFPSNTAALRLAEAVTKYQQLSEEAPPVCESCAHESHAGLAIASCLQCNVFLCANCLIVHKKLPLTRTHQIACLDDVKSERISFDVILNQKQDLCSVHNDRPLELFCKKEKCFLCLGCAIVKHRDHPYDYISQIVEEQREEMKNLLPDVKAKVNQLEVAVAEIEKQQLQIQKIKEENIMKIQQTFEEIMTTVVQRKKELLEKVNESADRKIRSLNKQLSEMEILIYQMRQYLEFTEKTIKSQSNTTVMCKRFNNRSQQISG